MANYANLIQQINASIKTNGANLITGQMLQTILDNMVASLGAKYQYAGVATPATNPGTPDQNVFYLAATAGTYTNFGGIVLTDGEVAALKYNGAWAKDTTGAASLEKVSQLGQQVNVKENKGFLIDYATSSSQERNAVPVIRKIKFVPTSDIEGHSFSLARMCGTSENRIWIYDINSNITHVFTTGLQSGIFSDVIKEDNNLGTYLYIEADCTNYAGFMFSHPENQHSIEILKYSLDDVEFSKIKIDSLEDDLEDCENDVSQLQGDVSQLQGDVLQVQQDVTELQDVVSDYPQKGSAISLKHVSSQLWDTYNGVPGNLNVTSGLELFAGSRPVSFVVEGNFQEGEYYLAKLITPATQSDLHIESMYIWASNTLEVGQNVLQRELGAEVGKYARITLNSSARYLGVTIVFSNDGTTRAEAIAMWSPILMIAKTNSGVIDIAYENYWDLDVQDKNLPSTLISSIAAKLNKNQGANNVGKVMMVGGDGVLVPSTTGSGNPGVRLIEDATFYLGADLLNGITGTLSNGWTIDGSGNYVHSGNYDDALIFNYTTIEGKKYMVFLDCVETGSTDSLRINIGNDYVDPYNGVSESYNAFVSDGGVLKIYPTKNIGITITKVELREILDDSTGADKAVTLELENVAGDSMENNLTGWINVSIGPRSNMQKNVNGSRCIAIGYRALPNFESGTRNIGIGTFALPDLRRGEYNVGIGADALFTSPNANRNTIVGALAMAVGPSQGTQQDKDEEVNYNTAVGCMAMRVYQKGSIGNTGVGYQACNYAKKDNVGVGYSAGYYTKGDDNVSVGARAGAFHDGSRNICIGSRAKAVPTELEYSTATNRIAIGYDATATKDNQIVIGNTDHTEIVLLGNKKIIFNQDGTVTWEVVS